MMATFAISWNGYYDRTGKTSEFYHLITLIGIILFFANFFYFIRKQFQKIHHSIIIALLAMILWILIEGSMDVSAFLVVYLIIFLPLVFYKYKLNRKG